MCGRYTLTAPVDELAAGFGVTGELPEVAPSYNIAPTGEVAAVGGDSGGERRLRRLRWGLIPSWADDPSIGARMINARSETVAEKPAFRSAFRRRRCLILADGFYEWQRPAEGEKGPKQPYYIKMADGSPYAFAGIWESWQDGDGEKVRSCAILTTEANDLVAGIHHRMPVVLTPGDYDRWLAPGDGGADLQSLLRPYPPEEMSAYPVSTYVNKPQNDDPSCLEPVEAG